MKQLIETLKDLKVRLEASQKEIKKLVDDEGILSPSFRQEAEVIYFDELNQEYYKVFQYLVARELMENEKDFETFVSYNFDQDEMAEFDKNHEFTFYDYFVRVTRYKMEYYNEKDFVIWGQFKRLYYVFYRNLTDCYIGNQPLKDKIVEVYKESLNYTPNYETNHDLYIKNLVEDMKLVSSTVKKFKEQLTEDAKKSHYLHNTFEYYMKTLKRFTMKEEDVFDV